MNTEETKELEDTEEIGAFHDAVLNPQKTKKSEFKAAKEQYAAAKKAIKERHSKKKDKGDVRIVSSEEKIYKTMKRSANLNLILGIISIVAGVATGVLLIISGARLHVKKTDLLF